MTAALQPDRLVAAPAELHGGFSRVDQAIQQQYGDIPIEIATAIGQGVASTPARVAALFGSCSKGGTSVDAACLNAFIKSFGEIALRHPLPDDDVTFYAAVAGSDPLSQTDIARVIAVMLASPRFLYRIESGDQQVTDSDDVVDGANLYRLDAWQLASRLSYHFWGTMPDATLRDAANSGKLMTDDGYASEVDRIAADPRAASTLRAFFEQWLWPLDALPSLDSRVGDPAFVAFAGSDLPGPSLRDHMIADVLDAASWVSTHDGSVSDLLTNRQSFAKDADLAAIYGIPAWNGKGEPPMLPDGRKGLLTRAAFLTTGSLGTRPIMKGVFIRTTLLCDAIPPPPNNAASTPIVYKPNGSTRDALTALTERPGTTCIACHGSLINPLGFASENFDALGRPRSEEKFFDNTGAPSGSARIDTNTVPSVVAGDPTSSTGIGDVTELIAKSGKAEACLAGRYFRFAFRRIESSMDGNVISALAEVAKSGTLADLFKGVALRPEFKQRVIKQ